MKRVILAILSLVCVGAALWSSSPYSVLKAKEELKRVEDAKTEYLNAKRQYETSKQTLVTAQSIFDNGRSFEIYYGDIPKLKQLFDGLAGMSVVSILSCDARNNFTPEGLWDEGSDYVPSAVKVSLTVDDIVTSLAVINRMELPLQSITTVEPNLIDITFLTGEGIT